MKCRELKEMLDKEIEEFLDSFDTVLTDCDGVLWAGVHAIEGSPCVIRRLRDMGKRIYFVTNNSTKHRKDFFKKCVTLNFGGNEDEVLSAGYVTAWYLKESGFKGKVYLLGSKGIAQELDDAGINYCGLGPCDYPTDCSNHNEATLKILSDMDPDINCVLVTFDPHISYPKIVRAVNYLNKPECLFIATNTDSCMKIGSVIVPGTGAIVASVSTPAERAPMVLGKPHEHFFEIVKKMNPKIDPKRTLMIGDRCNTDILFGKNCGLRTLLVGSGVHTLKDVRGYEAGGTANESRLVPEFYLDKLADLLPLINRVKKIVK